ncbi:hypothetical protein DmAi_26350 [Acetobacter persici]|uniref:Uncharacterized protein n=1 Tax=Acetobacter persici TaxID=1076596 RepID=A0A6V8IDD5_9PROT|nr:hypothetical protein DmAi_26350 [Acetobacter persici]
MYESWNSLVFWILKNSVSDGKRVRLFGERLACSGAVVRLFDRSDAP